MKINILYNFKDGPFGGGNQFLKILKNKLQKDGFYAADPEQADVILLNSYPFGAEYLWDRLREIKNEFPEKITILRLDGPISLIRGQDKEVEKIIHDLNEWLIDGIIFQSHWSAEKNKELFKIKNPNQTVIHNAADNEIFNAKNARNFSIEERVKLVATSWSNNWNKGFEIYQFLDRNLDWNKYEMTFVGNSPIPFKNIKWIKPVPSRELAEIIKQHDIFVTASKNDPCSNSLIEALSCGRPALVLNDGGHPELLGQGGECFNDERDLLEKLDKIKNNYEQYQKLIPDFPMGRAAEKYYDFCQEIHQKTIDKKYIPKRIAILKWKLIKIKILHWKIISKIKNL